MPWKECTPVSSRYEFVLLAEQPDANVRELCRRFEISPKTAYKWLRRYREQGEPGLLDKSRRPLSCPRRSSEDLEHAVLALHEAYPAWGGRKLRSLMSCDESARPHHSTLDAILRRHGRPLRYGADAGPAATSRFEHEAPNDLWQMDFKGHFALFGQRQHCHPLTLLDDHSRFALCLAACADERRETVRQQLIRVFRRYGLPRRMTSDNGPPWGSTRRGGLSALEVWLMRLGIKVGHSRPHHPQTQGKLERFHQTLKRELLHDAHFRTLAQCQAGMDRWLEQYNQQRPHQALGQKPPLTRYRSSPRPYPEKLLEVEYEPGERVLTVHTKGQIRLDGRMVFVSEGLAGERVAIRPAKEDGVLDIIFINKTVRQVDLRQPE
ncbi:IS481 family transposase [Pseudomonas citronellolis]|uniref:IS481 family transposase n=1 Tax=Pseudomonas citronellolis TaxID=53408 RepID=UPI0021120A77|nr:IS481 family transposase [Pseudomonas citronellolis]MDN6871501.1 IS481 family transposase [Pseudomonas citronellolis]UUC47992.1 IS481 family transposase [Pseudomonas citronellolis]UUC48811.1 IS481 family transposase [Pseudomonas citronellolis]UUC49560.1 IS481 family transposase [Pseudomonas citronellolis]UUC53013.1 IS481 family transposase [Pseudomonas citronellolis]